MFLVLLPHLHATTPLPTSQNSALSSPCPYSAQVGDSRAMPGHHVVSGGLAITKWAMQGGVAGVFRSPSRLCANCGAHQRCWSVKK
uniref:Uncharacterized protein n=1 Tax=Arundo donax TaxID=35708 RepID=A0A0A9D2C3_ARUDO